MASLLLLSAGEQGSWQLVKNGQPMQPYDYVVTAYPKPRYG